MKRAPVSEIVAGIAGLATALAFVGYLAYALHAIPLWIIVGSTLLLAVAAFVREWRAASGKRATAEPQSDTGRK